MNYGLSDRVRARARAKYIQPGVVSGRKHLSISVKELLKELEAEGFPANHARQVCMALTSGKFLRENDLEIDSVEGPPSKTSTTVVVHYRVANPATLWASQKNRTEEHPAELAGETPEQWARRVTEPIRGLLKEELAAYGGGEAFLRWMRSEEEDEDAA